MAQEMILYKLPIERQVMIDREPIFWEFIFYFTIIIIIIVEIYVILDIYEDCLGFDYLYCTISAGK
jgi:hypothetical protein